MFIDFNIVAKAFRPVTEAFDSSAFDNVVSGVVSRQIMNDPNAVNQYISIAHRIFLG